MRKMTLMVVLVFVIFVSGCTSQSAVKEYVCPDGRTVSTQSLCNIDNTDSQPSGSDQSSDADTSQDTGTTNFCAGVTCPDKCEGGASTKLFYNGQCINGECSYASKVCENGCREDRCLTFEIGDGVCEGSEEIRISEEVGLGCIDCISVCNNDHTQICRGHGPAPYTYRCEESSLVLDGRFFRPSNWDHVDGISDKEFVTQGDTALIGMGIGIDVESAGNNWETYFSNIKGDTICYTTTGSYALGIGTDYKNLTLDSHFTCVQSGTSTCSVSTDEKTVTKLAGLKDYGWSDEVTYYSYLYTYGGTDTERPLTLECNIRVWSEDAPNDIHEDTFKISFV